MHFAQWTQFDAETSADNLLLHSDGHLLVATARSADGKARDLGSRLSSSNIYYLFYYFLLFLLFSTAFLSLLKGGAVCGASHAALGEAALLNS